MQVRETARATDGTPREKPPRRRWRMMRTMMLALFLAAGCGAADDPSALDEDAIQGGRRDGADPAVGLVWFAGGGFCSGSLIAPDVVLTAGHCVQQRVAAFYTGPGEATAQLGPLPIGKMTKHAVAAQAGYPGYSTAQSCPSRAPDVGLLRLASPIHGTKPYALAPDAPKLHTVCHIIGYGVHDEKGVATVAQKRRADVSVVSVEESSVEVTRKSGIADHGDSGGPLVCNGKLVGDTSCHTGDPVHDQEFYARDDVARDWVAKTIAAWR
jgi:hypothetical protein